MEKTAQTRLYRFSRRLTMAAEWLIALFLILGIAYLLLRMILEYGGYIRQGELFEFNGLLSQALNLVIGIELTRMLVYHDPHLLMDVLMFATTRQAVLDHSSVLENLMAVVAVLLLFGAKKYLFSSADKEKLCLFGWQVGRREEGPPSERQKESPERE